MNLTSATLLLGCAALLAGYAAGRAYFHAVRHSVLLYTEQANFSRALILTIARIAAAALVLLSAAQLGAPALLGVFGGFLLARWQAVRALRRAM